MVAESIILISKWEFNLFPICVFSDNDQLRYCYYYFVLSDEKWYGGPEIKNAATLTDLRNDWKSDKRKLNLSSRNVILFITWGSTDLE